MVKCAHSYKPKELKIINETCNIVLDKLIVECEQRKQTIVQFNKHCDTTESLLQMLDPPVNNNAKCANCNKEFHSNTAPNKHYKMEKHIDWIALLENIKYLDEDLETRRTDY